MKERARPRSERRQEKRLAASVTIGVVLGWAIGSLPSPSAWAQADFRRGDVNVDGVVDIGDLDALARYLFITGGSLACRDAADIDDDGLTIMNDLIMLGSHLYSGTFTPPPPGSVTPGPDATPGDALGCSAYNPASPPALASFALGFECGSGVPAAEGRERFEAFVTLTSTGSATGRGAAGWSVSLGAENLRLLAVTTAGTVAAFVSEGGLRDPTSYMLSEAVDPGLDTGGGPQGEGAVSAVLLSLLDDVMLPAEGTARILRILAEGDPTGGGIGAGRLHFVAGGLRGGGQPVLNRVAIDGTSQVPSLGSCEVILNDCNRNGVPDGEDVAGGGSADCNRNGMPDECEPDCDGDTLPDGCEIAAGAPDCDANGIPDACDIASGRSPDCNRNGVPDPCDIAAGTDPDCNTNGIPDSCDIAAGTDPDCNANGIPDSCDIASQASPDCDGNLAPDECDLASGALTDADGDGIPDECASCLPGGPVECPPGGGPLFRYSFKGPCQLSGRPGESRRFQVRGMLETHCLAPGQDGAQGWVLGFTVEGCRIVGAAFDGTHAAPVSEGGLRLEDGVARLAVIDPVRNEGKMAGSRQSALSR
jgi:hypothetical protein